MSKEYDFRFSGLAAIDHKNKQNALRVKAVRTAILQFSRGFTEIPPGICMDILPGEGIGYIVSLESEENLQALEESLQRLAKAWALPQISIHEAADGPRGGFSFLLIPELANPAEPGGFRRLLFKEARWARIEETFRRIGGLRVDLVYGEWKSDASDQSIQDVSRMFIIADASAAMHKRLEDMIRTDVSMEALSATKSASTCR
jgi:hypothetical protein